MLNLATHMTIELFPRSLIRMLTYEGDESLVSLWHRQGGLVTADQLTDFNTGAIDEDRLGQRGLEGFSISGR